MVAPTVSLASQRWRSYVPNLPQPAPFRYTSRLTTPETPDEGNCRPLIDEPGSARRPSPRVRLRRTFGAGSDAIGDAGPSRPLEPPARNSGDIR